MWKRMQGKVAAAKQPDYSVRPQDPDTTISPLDLRPMHEWDGRGMHPALRKPQLDYNQSEHSLPSSFENVEMGTAQQAHRRQASSVYSEHPPTIIAQRQQQDYPPGRVAQQNQASATFDEDLRHYEETVEISPPSSPEMSPIHVPQLTGPTTSMSFMPSSPPMRLPATTQKVFRDKEQSSIPVMRREKKQHDVLVRKAVAGSRNVSAPMTTSYDPYSQTAQSRKLSESQWETVNSLDSLTAEGRPLRPATQWPGAPTPTATNLEGMYGAPYAKQPQQSLSDRVRKMREGAGGKRSAPLPTTQRPEWKGASGRTAIVAAPQDNPHAAPLHLPIPRKLESESESESQSSKRVQQVQVQVQVRVPTRRIPSPSPAAAAAPAKYDEHYEERFTGRHSPLPARASPPGLDSLPSQKNRSCTPTRNLPPSVSTIERNFVSALAGVKVGSSSPTNANQHSAHLQRPQYPNEVSRFSVTTYAPSTFADSPRTSTDSAPPIPDIATANSRNPSLYSQASSSENSILNRKRGVEKSTHTFDKTTADLERPLLPKNTTLRVLAVREHLPDKGKALPKSPMELSQSDKCLALQAQLDDLALQRQNIDRSISAMTRLIPSTMTGLPPGLNMEGRKREMERRESEKKKVDGLKEELANVKSQEHEVGIKLHRALRKRDESGGYEPSGLWVRRVTG